MNTDELQLWQQNSPRSRLVAARLAINFYMDKMTNFANPEAYVNTKLLQTNNLSLIAAAPKKEDVTLPHLSEPINIQEQRHDDQQRSLNNWMTSLTFLFPVSLALLFSLAISPSLGKTAIATSAIPVILAIIVTYMLASYMNKNKSFTSKFSKLIAVVLLLDCGFFVTSLAVASLAAIIISLCYIIMTIICGISFWNQFSKLEAFKRDMSIIVNGQKLDLVTHDFLEQAPLWPTRIVAIKGAQNTSYNKSVQKVNQQIKQLNTAPEWKKLNQLIKSKNDLITIWNSKLLELDNIPELSHIKSL